MNDSWTRQVFGLRVSDKSRLTRLGQLVYPGQKRVDSTIVRAALIALEQAVAQNNGQMPPEVAAILREEQTQ